MTQGQIAEMHTKSLRRAWADAQPGLLLLGNAMVKAGQDANRLMAAAIEKHRKR